RIVGLGLGRGLRLTGWLTLGWFAFRRVLLQRVAVRRGGPGCVELVFGLALPNGLHRHPSFDFVDVHDSLALRVAASQADLFDARANRLAAIGDQHDLVLGFDHRDAHDRTVALAGIDQDDALAAAILGSELGKRGSLAEASLADRQHLIAI